MDSIRDVFDEGRDPIRDLNLIVKVFDNSSKSIWTEFEEFVITEALLKYLYQFYADFSASVRLDEPKMPFWLQGFYGSGKSHFLKVIGHIFQNSELVDQKGIKWNAIDFFIQKILEQSDFGTADLNKIKADLIAGLKLYPKQIRAKTLFINLSSESKSETRDDVFLESFTSALIKGFNKFLDLSEFIEIAEIEKTLIARDIYDKFKITILETEKEDWIEVRKNPEWVYECFPRIYSKVQQTDLASGERFLEGIKIKAKQKTIITVLEEINKWVIKELGEAEKGITPKMLIALDEAGFFFSSKESRIGELMAAAEWVNTPENEAHVNMIFSAQQSIPEYFKRMQTTVDYRTAEQRFKHWLLDKKNIKTVVVKRWLKKNTNKPDSSLIKLLDEKYHNIIDGTVFNTINDPNLEYVRPTREELFETYPFLPYQFPLMIQVTSKLISEKIVEEQYGGKTRSILSMTRDVLYKKYRDSPKTHFIEENLGLLVTLPQLYDSLTETLKKKDEDQFSIVDSTQLLVEDPTIFTVEERSFPVTFQDVAKTVLFLSFVDEVHVDDENIIRALWYSFDILKPQFMQKVKKLISELKKKGYIVYKKRDIEDEDGIIKSILEYRIPSQEERKYIEKTQHVAIIDEQVQKWLETFFKNKEGAGKDLIALIDQQNLPALNGPAGNSIDLDNALKIKLEWYIDPVLDEILGKISKGEHIASICILTNRTLEKFKENMGKLRALIQATITKASNSNKVLLFFTPNLSKTAGDITHSLDLLLKSIKECIRYQETIKQDLDMPGNVHNSFQQRIKDIEQEILAILREDFDGGTRFYSDKQDRIENSTINENLVNAIKYSWSRLNQFAYLGQVKISKEQIKFILTWDPKTRATIPPIFKKGGKIGTTIPLFGDSNDLKPNQSDQYNRVTLKFTEYKNAYPETDQVPGEFLISTFESPPFAWNDQLLLVTIAAIIRNGEWDVFRAGSIKNSNDDEIIDAFTDWKSNCDKFRSLNFKTAESITQAELNKAATILNDVFFEHVSQVGKDAVETAIKKNLRDFTNLIVEVKDDVQKLRFGNNLLQSIADIIQHIENILKTDRVVARIKSFIDTFAIFTIESEQKKTFINTRTTLNRAKELKDNGGLKKYYRLQDFFSSILPSWLSTQIDSPDIKDIKTWKDKVLNLLEDANVLSEKGWQDAWDAAKQPWDYYWKSYIALHEKLSRDIQEGIKKIEAEKIRVSYTKKVNTKKLSEEIFTCTTGLTVPLDLNSIESFVCINCKSDYNALRVFEGLIKAEIDRILATIKSPTVPTGGGEGGVKGGSGGDVVVVEHPIKQERECWKKYQELHKNIEKIYKDIDTQKSLNEKNPDLLKTIKKISAELKKKYSSFSSSHTCSDESNEWDIEQQACKSCKLNYNGLVDLNDAAGTAYTGLLDALREIEEKMLSQDFEVIIDVADESSSNSKIDEKVRAVQTILSTYHRNNPDKHQNVKIKILLEKAD